MNCSFICFFICRYRLREILHTPPAYGGAYLIQPFQKLGLLAYRGSQATRGLGKQLLVERQLMNPIATLWTMHTESIAVKNISVHMWNYVLLNFELACLLSVLDWVPFTEFVTHPFSYILQILNCELIVDNLTIGFDMSYHNICWITIFG